MNGAEDTRAGFKLQWQRGYVDMLPWVLQIATPVQAPMRRAKVLMVPTASVASMSPNMNRLNAKSPDASGDVIAHQAAIKAPDLQVRITVRCHQP